MRLGRFLLLLLLAFSLPTVTQAQATVPELESRLINKPLYIRGLWGEDNLHFDSYGQLIGGSKQFPFTLCGANIKKIQLKANQLVLEGKRVGLELSESTPKRIDLQGLRIAIDRPRDGDFGRALTAIFAEDLESLVPLLPQYWQPFAKVNLLPVGSSDHATSSTAFVFPSLPKVGGSVKPPKILKSVGPFATKAALDQRYSGNALVSLIVEENGLPSHLMVVRALGLGLDEQALAAVGRYVFAPATENGKPIRVQLNIEVNFDYR
jgi:hypothetical protein